MLTVVTLCLLAVVVLAQEPHPCESPHQFEGRFGFFNPDDKFSAHGRFAYDDDMRRYRETEEIQIGSDKEFLDKLYLHNLNLEYRVNLKTRQCNITTLTRPWIPYAVPRDARFRGEAVLGAAGIPDEHVTINVFDGKFEEGSYVMVVTAEDCLPVQSMFNDTKIGSVFRDLYDVSIGIRDPEAFIPPRECHQL